MEKYREIKRKLEQDQSEEELAILTDLIDNILGECAAEEVAAVEKVALTNLEEGVPSGLGEVVQLPLSSLQSYLERNVIGGTPQPDPKVFNAPKIKVERSVYPNPRDEENGMKSSNSHFQIQLSDSSESGDEKTVAMDKRRNRGIGRLESQTPTLNPNEGVPKENQDKTEEEMASEFKWRLDYLRDGTPGVKEEHQREIWVLMRTCKSRDIPCESVLDEVTLDRMISFSEEYEDLEGSLSDDWTEGSPPRSTDLSEP
jgi:hypothetical protein